MPSDERPPSESGTEAAGDGAEDLSSDGGEASFPDGDRAEEATVDDLLGHLETLEEAVDHPDEQREVRRAMRVARRVPNGGVFGRAITSFGTDDKAEMFVGSVVVGLPLLVEDGVFAIGDAFAETPAFFVANLAFTVALVVGILYVASFQHVRIRNPYLGAVPRRPVWAVLIAFSTAAALMTLWGRVTWADPWADLCAVSVVFTAMAIGASLGDILPGE